MSARSVYLAIKEYHDNGRKLLNIHNLNTTAGIARRGYIFLAAAPAFGGTQSHPTASAIHRRSPRKGERISQSGSTLLMVSPIQSISTEATRDIGVFPDGPRLRENELGGKERSLERSLSDHHVVAWKDDPIAA